MTNEVPGPVLNDFVFSKERYKEKDFNSLKEIILSVRGVPDRIYTSITLLEKLRLDSERLKLHRILPTPIDHDKEVLTVFEAKSFKKKVYDEYSQILKFLDPDEDNEDFDAGIYLASLCKLDKMFYFVFSHLVRGVKINTTLPLDKEFFGSTSRVFEAILATGEVVAAKVLHKNDVEFAALGFEECMDISLAGMTGFFPRFHGFFIDSNEKIVIIMDKVDGHYLIPTTGAYQCVNQKSIDTFVQKMSVLHSRGFTFFGDSGQLMITEDGTINFIDIHLKPLKNGKILNRDKITGELKMVEPEKAEWYVDNINLLNEICKNNSQVQL